VFAYPLEEQHGWGLGRAKINSDADSLGLNVKGKLQGSYFVVCLSSPLWPLQCAARRPKGQSGASGGAWAGNMASKRAEAVRVDRAPKKLDGGLGDALWQSAKTVKKECRQASQTKGEFRDRKRRR